MTELPQGFKDMLHRLLGDEAFDLIQTLDTSPVTSIRLNRRKPVEPEFPDMKPVAWCNSGYYLDERPEFIFDPLLHAGAYYVQDASSMIYETVVEKLLPMMPKGKKHILDMCASPGGKTTAMINALPDGSKVVANEYTSKRVGALRENLDRWGYPDATVTNKDSSLFAADGEIYDIVAVDAPCSGEGMMRKEDMARRQWTPELVAQCSILQREILRNAQKALKPGGFLIYSTCTFNREENEANAEFIAEELGLQPVDMNFPKEWGIMSGIDTELPVYRFMPHKTKGEGLFLAIFRKCVETSDRIPEIRETREETKEYTVSRQKKGRSLSSSQKKTPEELPEVEVDKLTAVSYLRGESIKLEESAPRGLVRICYKGLPLGEAKNIGSRANNLYPKNRRILKG